MKILNPINKIICLIKGHDADYSKDELCHRCNSEIKQHWYSYTFQGPDFNGNNNVTASTYVGYKYKFMNKKMIMKAKEYAGLHDNSVLLSFFYIGKMSKKVFEGEI